MSRVFSVNDSEDNETQAFIQVHACGMRHVTYNWVFHQTGIGWAVYIQCSKCGAEKNLTDYSSW